MKLRTKITAACLLLSCCAAAQVGYTYKPFENPGATVTRVFGMNNHGYVVGMDDSTPGRHAVLLNKKTHMPLDPTGTLGTHTSFARGSCARTDATGSRSPSVKRSACSATTLAARPTPSTRSPISSDVRSSPSAPTARQCGRGCACPTRGGRPLGL